MSGTTVAGVVLAAGEGRRMGRAKALCRAGGKTLLERMIRALRAGGCRPVVAVIREELLGTIRAECRLDGIELLVNPRPELGQISSLRLSLRVLAESRSVVVALVDQGDLQAETVDRVIRALGRAPAAVAAFRGTPGHPVAFGREVYPLLQSPIADQGAHAVVEMLRAEGRLMTVPADDAGVLRNINTPAELEAFRRSLRRR